MTILALDQSSHISGYCVFKDGELFAYDKFSFDNPDMGRRLTQIRAQIQTLIEQYKPDYVIFEDIQQQYNVSNNIQTFKVLAEVYGVISELLSSLNIPYSTVLASSWKSTLKIKGKTRAEQKKNAMSYIKEKYNIEVTQDMADAICIGEYHLNKEKCIWE